jgi:predicted nucleotidyltransferase
MLDTVYLTNPIEDVVPGVRGRLLATLVQLEVPVTIRALARYAGVAPQTALTVVNELSEAGIVSADQAGSARMVSLNRAHLASEPLIALGRTRARLVTRLTDELARWNELAGAWLFGSAARGSGDRESDVDILLVAERSTETASWTGSAAQIISDVHSWTGNPAQLLEHTTRSFAQLVRDRNPLVDAIHEDGIPLTPRSDALLRRLSRARGPADAA